MSLEKKKYFFLITAVFGICLFFLLIQLKIDASRHEYTLHRQMYDFKVKDFEVDQFQRLRPYINLLIDHYIGHDETIKVTCPEIEKNFDKIIKVYSADRTDTNFNQIFTTLKTIRDGNREYALKELSEAGAGPLTLATFFIAPLPSTFIYPMQIPILRNIKDELLLYLGLLRQPNINLCCMYFELWRDSYDKADFAKKYGNVLGYKEKMTLKERLNELLPEINLTRSTGGIDKVLKSSNAKFIESDEKRIRLDITIEKLVRKELTEVKYEVIVFKVKQRSTEYFTQISEKITIADGNVFYLKAMIFNRNGADVLVVFDPIYQIWTLFEDGKYILSMPRQIAKKYFNHLGTHLIYSRNL